MSADTDTAVPTAYANANATVDATTTASAANKTWIVKRKVTVVSRKHWRKTRGSLTALNENCHRAGGCFSSVSGSQLSCYFYRSLLGKPVFSK